MAQDGEKPKTWLERRERVKKTANNGNGMGMPLTIAVQMWPTPTSRDWKDGSAQACANVPVNALLGREIHQHTTDTGSLNPSWVEWLMGFPLGWTALERSATPSSRKSPN